MLFVLGKLIFNIIKFGENLLNNFRVRVLFLGGFI